METSQAPGFRVDIEDCDVIELAAWFWSPELPGRLHVRDLGKPHLQLGRRLCWVNLDSLSAAGLGLTYHRLCPQAPEDPLAGSMLVYLKLAPPSDAPDDPLALFLACEVRSRQPLGRSTYLGLHILAEGAPEAGDKALSLVNVERYGIADLTRWCDEKDRYLRSANQAHRPGLSMDRLLAEVVAAAWSKEKESGPEDAAKGMPPTETA
ncbi:MAG: hypothetical protein AB1916_15665 [Thermodesulfobacteriota bacterium]